MKANNRVLLPNGTWKEFPQKNTERAVKKGLKDEEPKDEIKEEQVKKVSKVKRKANMQAKKENVKLAKKEEKQANAQRLSGNKK